MEFHVIDSLIEFHWSRIDVTVVGISFDQFMIKLKHLDKTWSEVMN